MAVRKCRARFWRLCSVITATFGVLDWQRWMLLNRTGAPVGTCRRSLLVFFAPTTTRNKLAIGFRLLLLQYEYQSWLQHGLQTAFVITTIRISELAATRSADCFCYYNNTNIRAGCNTVCRLLLLLQQYEYQSWLQHGLQTAFLRTQLLPDARSLFLFLHPSTFSPTSLTKNVEG
jgi:hypothetical protein